MLAFNIINHHSHNTNITNKTYYAIFRTQFKMSLPFICLAKARNTLFIIVRPINGDGNEFCYHCRWFQPTDKKIFNKWGFSQIDYFEL